MNNKKSFLRSPLKRAFFSRVIAKAIDLFIVLILSLVLFPVGIFLALTYISLADGLQGGQSVGKKFIGFAVVSLDDGEPCSFKQSAIRNLLFSVPLFFSLIPMWGMAFTFLLGIPLALLELYLIFRLESGHRLGDAMADTTVVVMTKDEDKALSYGKSA